MPPSYTQPHHMMKVDSNIKMKGRLTLICSLVNCLIWSETSAAIKDSNWVQGRVNTKP